jgi:hypothetical protein
MINSVDPTKLGMDGSYDLYSKTCYWLICIDIKKICKKKSKKMK